MKFEWDFSGEKKTQADEKFDTKNPSFTTIALRIAYRRGEKSIATNYDGQHNDVEDVATTDIRTERASERESVRNKWIRIHSDGNGKDRSFHFSLLLISSSRHRFVSIFCKTYQIVHFIFDRTLSTQSLARFSNVHLEFCCLREIFEIYLAFFFLWVSTCDEFRVYALD